MESMRKVAVILHQGDTETARKVWRYNTLGIQEYTLAQVELELLMLFPALHEKDLRLDIYYHDSFVGRVRIDGDADLHNALTTFTEETDLNFRAFHVHDKCPEPSYKKRQNNDGDDDGDISDNRPPKVKKRKKTSECSTVTSRDELQKILDKCFREDSIADSEQPLFVDLAMETIVCKWCPSWKGSQQLKVINQHTKTAKSHQRAKQKALGVVPAEMKGVQSIRKYFLPTTDGDKD